MEIIRELESVLFEWQNPSNSKSTKDSFNDHLQIMRSYAEVDGAIVVLSDLIKNKSRVCIGMLGNRFGFKSNVNHIFELESIWEKDIFNKIHPDDLFQKHILELKYFHFLKKTPPTEQSKYSTSSKIRMLNIDGKYQYIHHSTLYFYDPSNNNLVLALCVYKTSLNQTLINGINGKIVNKETGLTIEYKEYNDCSELLSSREKEILRHIQKGYLSKEIADILEISQNTVNRHRQNILKKIGVNNSFEAIKIADAMDLL